MKRSIYNIIAAMALGLALTLSEPAVAGPFEDFFQASGANAEDGVRTKSPPQVLTSNDLKSDIQRMLEDGYFVLGVSAWVGRPESTKNTAKFAKKIKASVALVKYRYIETVSGGTQVVMMPVIGGYGGMIGGARPLSFDRYEQTTYFLSQLKAENVGLGIRYEPLTAVQARAIGSGRGLSISAVVRGSPAFDAGILAGDIILSVAEQDISTRDRMNSVRAEYAGQTVPVEIIRDGQAKTLQIKMPAATTAQAKR